MDDHATRHNSNQSVLFSDRNEAYMRCFDRDYAKVTEAFPMLMTGVVFHLLIIAFGNIINNMLYFIRSSLLRVMVCAFFVLRLPCQRCHAKMEPSFREVRTGLRRPRLHGNVAVARFGREESGSDAHPASAKAMTVHRDCPQG
jgi:hypothetical protein